MAGIEEQPPVDSSAEQILMNDVKEQQKIAQEIQQSLTDLSQKLPQILYKKMSTLEDGQKTQLTEFNSQKIVHEVEKLQQQVKLLKKSKKEVKKEQNKFIEALDKKISEDEAKKLTDEMKCIQNAIKKANEELAKLQEKIQSSENLKKIQWDEYYIKIACLAALRSKDPRTPVGACIVDSENEQIVGIGYNSMPKDKDFTWKGLSSTKGTSSSDPHKNDANPKLKYAYVVHAAVNAILNKTKESIKGCTLYTTLHPDDDCARAIVTAGIKEVVYCMYKRDKNLDDGMKIADAIFDIKGVRYRELPDANLADDKYVRELQNRIDVGKQEPSKEETGEKEPSKKGPSTDRKIEPATTISQEKFFMRMAKLSQKRPGDFQNKAVGACIATPDKQIMAVEYSGEPDGIEDEIKKAKELHGLILKEVPEFYTHAEYRAIVGRPSVQDCTLYVTSYPCNVCAKVIVESGIKEVVHYKNGDWNDDRYYSSREILTTCLGPSNIRKYGSGDSKNESQDEASRSIAIEEPGRIYIGKITITDVQ